MTSKNFWQITIISSMFLLIGSMSASASEYSLNDAVLLDYVNISINATGEGHAGECLDLVISNNRSYSITVVIAAGTILKPSNTSYQKMVVGRTEQIYLCAFQVRHIKIYAFCADFEAKAPIKGVGFSCAVTYASADLKKVVNTIWDCREEMKSELKSKLTEKELQAMLVGYDNMANVAIWTVTNNINREKFTNWLVTEKRMPRAKAEAEAKEIQQIVNYLLARANIQKRF